jgi:hypothetical protein
MATTELPKASTELQSGIQKFDATKLKHTDTEVENSLPSPDGN